jgi:hypothetical protein
MTWLPPMALWRIYCMTCEIPASATRRPPKSLISFTCPSSSGLVRALPVT